MFNYLKYRLELMKLEKSSRRLSKEYDEKYKRIVGKPQEYHAELNELVREQDELQIYIYYLQTRYYQEKCNKYIIPMPSKAEVNYYFQHDFDNEEGAIDILTIEGFYKVRSLIRQVEKENREIVGFWVTLTIGLLGAVIGVISVLK